MAYDPNDPADKKIVDKLIAAALEEASAEHDANIEGVKGKNKELLAKLAKAQAGENNAQELARLEEENQTLKGQVTTGTRELTKLNKKLEEANGLYETEAAARKNLSIDHALTGELVGNNVPKHFLTAAKALLASQVELRADNGETALLIKGKPLGDFVKEWSQGDEGKHFVSAPNNSGAGAQGNGTPNNSGKPVMTRAEYDTAANSGTFDPKFFADGGTISD